MFGFLCSSRRSPIASDCVNEQKKPWRKRVGQAVGLFLLSLSTSAGFENGNESKYMGTFAQMIFYFFEPTLLNQFSSVRATSNKSTNTSTPSKITYFGMFLPRIGRFRIDLKWNQRWMRSSDSKIRSGKDVLSRHHQIWRRWVCLMSESRRDPTEISLISIRCEEVLSSKW